MPKRKQPDTISASQPTPSKRYRESPDASSPSTNASSAATTPSKSRGLKIVNGTNTPTKSGKKSNSGAGNDDSIYDIDSDATPKPNGRTLFATPSRTQRDNHATPSRSAKADRSAKRKSTRTLLLDNVDEEENWDNSAALAREILGEENDEIVDTTEDAPVQDEIESASATTSAPQTPSRGRGRPKGAKNKRSPTPEGDLPPEERYFFQNRLGPPKVSSNSFSSLGLLSHDEYFEHMRKHEDNHQIEKAYLLKLHTRSFPQWKFELEEGFSVCIYGWGSKRKLLNKFAEWLYPRLGPRPKVVILNGYVSRINIRHVLGTIGSALVGEGERMKLTGQPHDMIDTIFAHLAGHTSLKLVVVINSIDAPALRRTSAQSVLAKLASNPSIQLITSADTPNWPIMWSSTLKDQFSFVYHDCTTFAPYDVETNPVDDVNELLGRKNRRAGGKEGVGFVLKSLPENARNLYRVLLTEILTIANDGRDDGQDEDEAAAMEDGNRRGPSSAEEIGIEYRSLYQKASEEFICSSDMNFRFLLKEFYDHQMLTSRRDASGTELLGVPLARDEMEAVLEDLVLG